MVTSEDQAVKINGRVIPETEHPITLEMIDPDALYTMRKLNSAGFSAYLVGGGVRDLYLGNPPKDFDISTNARPGQIRKLFPNSQTIGRRFRLVQIFFKRGKVIEVSTLRSLSEHDLDGPEAVLAPNNTFGSLDEDAQRRDLTINSLFYEIESHTIIDYVDGTRDLDESIIRIVGDPDKRINRDPVRMMRAIRHCARNNFTIEELSWKSICDNHDKLLLCPPSRIRDETLKDIYGGSAAAWYKLSYDSGIFYDLFPLYAERLFNNPNKERALSPGHLEKIFSLIDRINRRAIKHGISRQPDSFMFALILMVWAEQKFGIYSTHYKGPALYQISKQIRVELDNKMGQHLNLRRSLRQDITVLLTNLSLLIHNRQKSSWPKWLKKKSYFNRCLLFYHCYIEVTSAEKTPDELLGISSTPHDQATKKKNRSTNKRKRPAFSSKSQKGVFGFKKNRHS